MRVRVRCAREEEEEEERFWLASAALQRKLRAKRSLEKKKTADTPESESECGDRWERTREKNRDALKKHRDSSKSTTEMLSRDG